MNPLKIKKFDPPPSVQHQNTDVGRTNGSGSAKSISKPKSNNDAKDGIIIGLPKNRMMAGMHQATSTNASGEVGSAPIVNEGHFNGPNPSAAWGQSNERRGIGAAPPPPPDPGGPIGLALAAAKTTSAAVTKLKDAQIDKLLQTKGTATAVDAKLVRAELRKLPLDVLKMMASQGIKVTVVRNSITEALPDLKGKRPRGWSSGTWDDVPGIYSPSTKQVVIATRATSKTDPTRRIPPNGDGHGSANLVIHEAMHGYNDAVKLKSGNHASDSKAFTDARDKDVAKLSDYEKQPGTAGREETFSESAALYYGGFKTGRPNIDQYFKDNVGSR